MYTHIVYYTYRRTSPGSPSRPPSRSACSRPGSSRGRGAGPRPLLLLLLLTIITSITIITIIIISSSSSSMLIIIIIIMIIIKIVIIDD